MRPFRAFFRLEAAGGITLIVATLVAVAWANSRFSESYQHLLHLPVTLSFGERGLSWPLHHWINDALMSVFFLVVGMEIKRELVIGELRSIRRATLPLLAALGGMLVPAGLHYLINKGGPAEAGWGIPMATDIAFALGCIALVSRRVPSSLVVFLMALAIFDDLGAILVIAFFYGGALDLGALGAAGVLTLVLAGLTRARVTRVWPYLLIGLALWVAVLRSGIHATIAGVILGLAIPAKGARTPSDVLGDLDQAIRRLRRAQAADVDAAGPLGALEAHLESAQAPLDRMVRGLHPVVAFLIVPVFAIANAGVAVSSDISTLMWSNASIGVMLGLVIGKPLGIMLATWLGVVTKLAPKPTGSTWVQIFGASCLAGIGFTMSIFVGSLAFPQNPELLDASKVGIFAASLVAGVLGLFVLSRAGAEQDVEATAPDLEVEIDLTRYADGFRVEPWVAAGPWCGRTLADLALRPTYGVTVIGVHSGGRGSQADRGMEPAGPDYRVTAGDTLLVVGAGRSLDRFLHAAAIPKAPRSGEYGRAFDSIAPAEQ